MKAIVKQNPKNGLWEVLVNNQVIQWYYSKVMADKLANNYNKQ